MTGKPGQGRDSETGSNWPRRGDGHRLNKFLNKIYRVIHIRKLDDNKNKAPPDQKCIMFKSENQQPTAAMEPRLLHRIHKFLRKIGKPKCDFGALQQLRIKQ